MCCISADIGDKSQKVRLGNSETARAWSELDESVKVLYENQAEIEQQAYQKDISVLFESVRTENKRVLESLLSKSGIADLDGLKPPKAARSAFYFYW